MASLNLPRKIRIWDLPTRIFHWLLAACIVALLISGKIGGEAMVWHARFGMLALALILFRLAWGVLGPHYARFAEFVKGPSALLWGSDWPFTNHESKVNYQMLFSSLDKWLEGMYLDNILNANPQKLYFW